MFTDNIHSNHQEPSKKSQDSLGVSLEEISNELSEFKKLDNNYIAEQNKIRISEVKKRAERIKGILRAHIERINAGNMGRYNTAKKYIEQAIESCDQCMNTGLLEHDLDHAHLSFKHFGDVHSHIQSAIGLLQQVHSINNGRHTTPPQLHHQPHHDLHAHTHEPHHGGGGISH